MAAMALWNTYRACRVEQQHPPRGRYISVDGALLHYLERGEGWPVLLLHGNVVTADNFALSGLLDLAAGLQCRVVALDRPDLGTATGRSARCGLLDGRPICCEKALETLGMRRPVVVRHSRGTLVDLALALDPRKR
jgi:pimeloyl-ACP methyl ester carboxylesterase